MTVELVGREAGGARDGVEHLRRHDLDGRDEHDLRAALEEREAVTSVVDVETGSEQRGHTGLTIDRPSHGQPWLRTACRPRYGRDHPFDALSRAHPTVEPWPYVTRRPTHDPTRHGLATVQA
jgi:hypothetical protein